MIARLALTLLLLLPLLALAAEDYYKLLSVPKDADSRQLKKAYRKLSKQFHPDKNPDDETAHQRFVEISEAYDVLSDDALRRVYDQYGHEGVKQHQQGGGGGGGGFGRDPFDVFSQFFGGGGHFGRGRRHGPDMEVRVHMPLRDFYVGAEHEFRVEKQVICEKCSGSGSEDGERETCGKCKGHGMVVQKHMLAPGIFQQVQMQCDACGGQGSTVKHACPACGGARVVRGEEAYDLHIEPGMRKGARVVYENEADESPDYEAGNLVVTVLEKEPVVSEDDEAFRNDGAFFRRKERNLFWREALSLREAWMGGWTRNLTHLDGHVVRLERKRGEVVQPGAVEVIEGEGMPVWNHEGDGPEFGSLHVEYVVVLPDQMEKGMEKDFFELWEKWRLKKGVDLHKDSGRPVVQHDEL